VGSAKTAISIPEPLARQVDRLAKKMRISRSRFFAKAAEDFIRRNDTRAMLKKPNEVYADGLTDEDKDFLAHAKAAAAKLAEREEW